MRYRSTSSPAPSHQPPRAVVRSSSIQVGRDSRSTPVRQRAAGNQGTARPPSKRFVYRSPSSQLPSPGNPRTVSPVVQREPRGLDTAPVLPSNVRGRSFPRKQFRANQLDAATLRSPLHTTDESKSDSSDTSPVVHLFTPLQCAPGSCGSEATSPQEGHLPSIGALHPASHVSGNSSITAGSFPFASATPRAANETRLSPSLTPIARSPAPTPFPGHRVSDAPVLSTMGSKISTCSTSADVQAKSPRARQKALTGRSGAAARAGVAHTSGSDRAVDEAEDRFRSSGSGAVGAASPLPCAKEANGSPSSEVRSVDQSRDSAADEHPSPPQLSVGSPTAAPAQDDDKERDWHFVAPSDPHRTFFFPEDNLEFSSEFDSGNLIQVERTGPFTYDMYSAMDCTGSETQTNNRQWFHFSVRGGTRATTISITMVGLLYSSMYTYEWMPVMAVLPGRPAYMRLPGRAIVVPLDAIPPTPGYPCLVYRDPAERRRALERAGTTVADGEDSDNGENGIVNDNNDDENDDPADIGGSGSRGKAKGRKRRKKPVAMNLTFEFRLDHLLPLESTVPLGHPDCQAIYIASNHPYAYSTLQRHLLTWQRQAATAAGVSAATVLSGTSAGSVWNYAPNYSPSHSQDIYFHREVLCKTLEGRNVDLVTISDMNGLPHGEQSSRMPLLTFNGKPAAVELPQSASEPTKQCLRPHCFSNKRYVVLSARVHAGECPGSHIMHGCVEFLMNSRDPRAIALRRHFVFFMVPMLNPDGVARGHSRVDANGVDLNRMYRNPSYKKHSAAYGLWALLTTLAAEGKLALYIDLHAHANKRGTFFYGNGMDAALQVSNLLYPKLVSLNTPYLEFKSCNYSESNMSAVTRSGLSKDCSCRVVLYTETGVIHSYAVEASYVSAKSINAIEPVAAIPGEDVETVVSMRYSPATFTDTGKAFLVALLDLHDLNPASRVPLTAFQSVSSVALWLQRQLQIELAEKLFVQAYKDNGRVEPGDSAQSVVAAIMSRLSPNDYPEKVTVRGCRHLPPTTVSGVKDFVSVELATTLLAQTPPSGPPRSFLTPSNRRGSTSSLNKVAAVSEEMQRQSRTPVSSASPNTATPPPVMAQRKTD